MCLRVTGSSSATLSIATAAREDSGMYSVVLSNACGETTSIGVSIVVRCAADWNNDGGVESEDFFLFLPAFFTEQADVDGDGITTSGDFFAFIQAFFLGC